MEQIEKYIDQLLNESSAERPMWNQEMILEKKKTKWNYIDGCMMTAFLRLYNKTADVKYINFVKEFIDYFVEESGDIKTFDVEEYNLDNINEARSLFVLYDHTGDEKYKLALDNIYRQLEGQPRTKEGNFWHKQIYPNQVWLDGIYMALPFYMEYDKRFNNKGNYDDIRTQLENVVKFMKNSETGLYYHAFDSSREMFWCDKETGLSRHYWLRATGWFVMALVDLMEILDESDVDFKNFVSGIFKDLVSSVLKYQEESGMWYQVVDLIDREPNYLETSGTAIISYAILKAVDLGILPKSYKEFGIKAFNGICDKYLTFEGDKPSLGGTCLVAGLGGKNRRDGSFDYYMSEPVVKNEAKGIAPFLLAYVYL